MTITAPEPLANLGLPEPRLGGRDKVTGLTRYPSDIRVDRPGYAFLVTSPIANGRLTAIDDRDACTVPGVLEIFTAANTDALHTVPHGDDGLASTSIQGLGPEIFHHGQIVAMTVAETFESARDAAHRLVVRYEAQPATASFGSDGAVTEDAALVMGAVTAVKEWLATGDAAAAFAAAPVQIDQTYATPTQHHNPLELFTTTCLWDGDRLTVHESSQFVYGLKNAVAQRLDMAAENIHVLSRHVGGAFGSRGAMTPRTGLVALAARRLGRPVKLVPTRTQGFALSTNRAETRHHVRLGAGADGRITAYAHEGWELTSRPDTYSVKGTNDTAHLYAFGAVSTKVNVVRADRATPGFMRSPPVVPYVYALESALDELAIKLGMDPVELRRVNDSMTDSFGTEWSSRSLMECYDQAAAAFDWAARDARPGSMRDGDWLVGWGCATAAYGTHMAATTVRVRLRADGRVLVQTAAHDVGTGAYTALAQMAASELGVPLGGVEVELGDSTLPPGAVSGGSTTTASSCSAIILACDAIKAKLAPGAAWGGIDALGAVFDRAGLTVIEQYAEYIPDGAGSDSVKKLYDGQATLTGGAFGKKLMYALGAEFVEVRVHVQTREVRCSRAVGAFAAGRIINPRTARSQLMGGMIWGISSALHEATEFDDQARPVNANLAEYLIPVNADIPAIEVILVPETDAEVNPAGVKGLGELGNVGTAAAITNAVYHATGVRIRDLPVRIEKTLV